MATTPAAPCGSAWTVSGNRLLRQSPQHSVTPPDAIERLRFEQRPHLALLAMPDSDFRSALEHGIAAAFEAAELQYDTPDPVRYHVNALFHRRGIPYEVFGTGSLIPRRRRHAGHRLGARVRRARGPSARRCARGVRGRGGEARGGRPEGPGGRDRGEPQGR